MHNGGLELSKFQYRTTWGIQNTEDRIRNARGAFCLLYSVFCIPLKHVLGRLDALQAEIDLGLSPVVRRMREVAPKALEAGEGCVAHFGVELLPRGGLDGLVAEVEDDG